MCKEQVIDLKVCNTCGHELPITEFNKAKNNKDGHENKCKACRSAYHKAHYYENHERLRKQKDLYYQENKHRQVESRAAYQKKYVESGRAAEYRKEWDEANPDYAKEYRQSPEGNAIRRALNAKRRAQKLQATPAWADHEAIKAIYAEARRLEDVLGIEMHCDHVIPLQGELVCGLHVETNLQIIPAALNVRKSNKFKVQ